MPAVATPQTGLLNVDLFGSDSCYEPPLQGRRKAGDLPDKYACVRLISHGQVILSGKAALDRFEIIRQGVAL